MGDMTSLLRLVAIALFHVQLARSQERMQVIGAGLGRTGTNSLKLALEQLGYKTMHMERLLFETKPKVLGQAYSKFVTTPGVFNTSLKDISTAAVDELLDVHAAKGFNASTDFPTCVLYLHQLRRNPTAKIILTLRSSAETWAESFLDTIARESRITQRFPLNMWFPPSFGALRVWMYTSVGMRLDPDSLMPSLEDSVAAYKRWEAHVRASVPAEQLLVHEFRDGWKPLCDFLGVPIPEGPYPRAPNDRAFMKRVFGTLDVVGRFFPLIFLATVLTIVLLSVLIYRCCGCFCCRRCCIGGQAHGKKNA
eukprot:TRINITY_DN8326_c0_g1_i8.p1 TRINITY_DN8326_c0_g1~~TRINITY_DN8326_c0_g1_i8.p1  ORF type:complete len:308 (-),score=31.89 TRINITY_DN8326_c0_g1_i8:88-1011(-)